jgi:hypothetical protein
VSGDAHDRVASGQGRCCVTYSQSCEISAGDLLPGCSVVLPRCPNGVGNIRYFDSLARRYDPNTQLCVPRGNAPTKPR